MGEKVSASDKGLEIGRFLNDFLRDKKQIPHATPKFFNPKIQGWLNGFTSGYAEELNFNDEETHMFISAVYINMFDGTSTGQRMGLDTLSERARIMNTGATVGYNQVYFDHIPKGKEDAKSYILNPQHELLLYSLL